LSKEKRVPALRLTLGGAPSTPHWVMGLPGYYFTDHPTPVGGDGECPLEAAEQAHKQPGCALELVHISPEEAAAAREFQAHVRAQAAKGIVPVIRGAESEDELDLAKNEASAALGGAAKE
jgi:hypothetical protein